MIMTDEEREMAIQTVTPYLKSITEKRGLKDGDVVIVTFKVELLIKNGKAIRGSEEKQPIELKPKTIAMKMIEKLEMAIDEAKKLTRNME